MLGERRLGPTSEPQSVELCLVLDLMAPFREGEDQEAKRMGKHAMVGALTVPIDQEAPMVQGLKNLRKREIKRP